MSGGRTSGRRLISGFLLAIAATGLSIATTVAQPAAARHAGSAAASLVLSVDDSKEDLACGVGASAGGSAAPYKATIVNSTNVAVSVAITGDGIYTLAGPELLRKFAVLSPHTGGRLTGTFTRAGQKVTIICDAGNEKAVFMNAIVRPLLSAISPISLDDADAITEFQSSFNWNPLMSTLVQHIRDKEIPWLIAKGAPEVVAAVKRWEATTAGKRWLVHYASKGSMLLKIAEWAIQEGKDLGSYATFAIAHGQRSIVVLSALYRPAASETLHVDFATGAVSYRGLQLVDPTTRQGMSNPAPAFISKLGHPSSCDDGLFNQNSAQSILSWDRIGLRIWITGPSDSVSPCGQNPTLRLTALDVFVNEPFDPSIRWTIGTNRGTFVLGTTKAGLPPGLRTIRSAVWGLSAICQTQQSYQVRDGIRSPLLEVFNRATLGWLGPLDSLDLVLC